jgi:hypothetical protein
MKPVQHLHRAQRDAFVRAMFAPLIGVGETTRA